LKTELAFHPWPSRSAIADLLLAFGSALVLALGSIALSLGSGGVASIWLANAVAISIAASAPGTSRTPILLVAALGSLIATLISGKPLMGSLAFLPGNLVEMLLGTHLLARYSQLQRFSSDPKTFLRILTLGSLIPPLVGALAGSLLLSLVGYVGFSDAWMDWFISAAIGSLVTLPLMLSLRARQSLKGVRIGSTLLTLTLVAAVSLASFALAPNPFGLVSVVLLVTAYLQPRLVVFAAAPLVVVAFAVAVGHGWLVPATADTPLGHLLMHITLLLVVIPPQAVAVIVARQRALDEILAVVGGQANQLAAFIDMQGILRWANKARADYWGVPNELSMGESWLGKLRGGNYISPIQPLFEQALAGQKVDQVMSVDFPVRGLRTMAVHLQPAFDEESHQVGVLYTSTDVTDLEASRKQLEALAGSLQTSNQDLQHFVRVSSHDLREPLNTIAQFSSLIEEREEHDMSPESRTYLRHVKLAAQRMGVLLEDIRLYVQVDEADPDKTFREVDLDELVDGVVDALSERVQQQRATIRFTSLGRAWGDSGQLALAVKLLLSNALKFVPADRAPDISITTTRSKDHLALVVSDNGIGIDADKLPLLGEPFKRLHSRRVYEGSGLGLAICKRIARKHGGDLRIDSTPQVGSQFTLTLALPSGGEKQLQTE
jgi:signal transduction histidine kinase